MANFTCNVHEKKRAKWRKKNCIENRLFAVCLRQMRFWFVWPSPLLYSCYIDYFFSTRIHTKHASFLLLFRSLGFHSVLSTSLSLLLFPFRSLSAVFRFVQIFTKTTHPYPYLGSRICIVRSALTKQKTKFVCVICSPPARLDLCFATYFDNAHT